MKRIVFNCICLLYGICTFPLQSAEPPKRISDACSHVQQFFGKNHTEELRKQILENETFGRGQVWELFESYMTFNRTLRSMDKEPEALESSPYSVDGFIRVRRNGRIFQYKIEESVFKVAFNNQVTRELIYFECDPSKYLVPNLEELKESLLDSVSIARIEKEFLRIFLAKANSNLTQLFLKKSMGYVSESFSLEFLKKQSLDSKILSSLVHIDLLAEKKELARFLFLRLRDTLRDVSSYEASPYSDLLRKYFQLSSALGYFKTLEGVYLFFDFLVTSKRYEVDHLHDQMATLMADFAFDSDIRLRLAVCLIDKFALAPIETLRKFIIRNDSLISGSDIFFNFSIRTLLLNSEESLRPQLLFSYLKDLLISEKERATRDPVQINESYGALMFKPSGLLGAAAINDLLKQLVYFNIKYDPSISNTSQETQLGILMDSLESKNYLLAGLVYNLLVTELDIASIDGYILKLLVQSYPSGTLLDIKSVVREPLERGLEELRRLEAELDTLLLQLDTTGVLKDLITKIEQQVRDLDMNEISLIDARFFYDLDSSLSWVEMSEPLKKEIAESPSKEKLLEALRCLRIKHKIKKFISIFEEKLE